YDILSLTLIVLILSSNSSKYLASYLFPLINLSSFNANPFVMYSFNTLVAQILNCVAFLEFTLYPTAIITSKLYILVLYFLPSEAVNEDSSTTEFSSSSPSLKIFFKCKEILSVLQPKTFDILF